MSRTIKCRAVQDGDTWTACIAKHGVYGYGRTLKALQDNLAQGLALVGVSAEVTITPVSPELERLRAAEAAYEAALTKAIAAMTARQSPVRDIAQATGAPVSRVTAAARGARKT